MSQSNSHLSGKQTPHKYHHSGPTKTQIFAWIHSILPFVDKGLTIESLGNGVIYCKILNHYVPGSILSSRIITNPFNEYESSLNLKQLQLALTKLKINIPFDINRVTKQRFIENWNLIVLFHKQLEGGQFRKPNEEKIGSAKRGRQPSVKEKEKEEEAKEKACQNYFGNSQIFQKGGLPFMVDRVKEILISNCNDTYKMQMIRKLFGVEDEVKLEENEEESTRVMQKTSKLIKK